MSLFLIAVATALLVSALCSLLEATLLSLTPAQLAEMSTRHPRAAAIWQRFKVDIERPIAVILILNTSAHTIGASVAGAEFERLWGERWLAAFALLLTYLMLQFTEILPKTLGVAHSARIAPLVARPLETVARVLTPVIRFIHLVNRPFERRGELRSSAIDEITALARVARTAGAIDARQARMIDAAHRLPRLRVRQIMTPRTEVVYLRLGQPLSEVLDVVQRSLYTRLPVCETDADDIAGMIHVRDLFNHLNLVAGGSRAGAGDDRGASGPLEGTPRVIGSGDVDLRRIMRRIMTVPDGAFVGDLLRRFQESRVHMAVVVDEYGSTVGVVTLEDVLEEMVGEIEDEFDLPRSDEAFVEVAGGWRTTGSLGLHEFRERFALYVEDEDVDTLGGFIQKRLGRFAEAGDVLRVGRFEFRVVTLERRRIGTVEFRVIDDVSPG